MQSRLRYAKITAVALFVALIPVFFVATNVRWVVNLPRLYSYGFDKYDIPVWTGIERSELVRAGAQIRDYFNNSEETIDVRVVLRGEERSIFNEREVRHMEDVKGLVQGVYRIQLAAGIYLIAFFVIGLALARGGFLPRFTRYASLGGCVTLALFVLLGVGAAVGFERLFLAFHLVSFSNDLWQLDPATDFLIAMFPEGFFYDATMLIAASTIVEALILSMATPLLLWWKPWTKVRGLHVGKTGRRPVANSPRS